MARMSLLLNLLSLSLLQVCFSPGSPPQTAGTGGAPALVLHRLAMWPLPLSGPLFLHLYNGGL